MENVFLSTLTILLHYSVALVAVKALYFGQFACWTCYHLTDSL